MKTKFWVTMRTENAESNWFYSNKSTALREFNKVLSGIKDPEGDYFWVSEILALSPKEREDLFLYHKEEEGYFEITNSDGGYIILRLQEIKIEEEPQ